MTTWRREVRAWLEANVPAGPLPSIETPEGLAAHKEWECRLFEAGYAAIHWPKAVGGMGADLLARTVFQEEYERAAAPPRLNGIGLIVVGPTVTQLKVTLVWTDAPAAVMAGLTPINNLNLSVHSPSAAVYLGNVFSGAESMTGGSSDSVNNSEQVHLAAPEAGVWRIDVAGTAVNQDTQGYALVVTGDVDCIKGDVNGDGILDGLDVQEFVQILLGGGPFFPKCAADMNYSGAPDIMDVDGFVSVLLGA